MTVIRYYTVLKTVNLVSRNDVKMVWQVLKKNEN